MKALVPTERIENKILLLRGQKVMIDRDLADLYGINTKRLVEQVKRNIERFPEDFMFQLSQEEFENWRSQFATSKADQIGLRRPPYAFTEHGVAMLSCVLKSGRAVQVNIQIVRAFVKIRQMLASHEDIRRKLEEHDHKIGVLIDAVQKLLAPPPAPPKRKIGFDS